MSCSLSKSGSILRVGRSILGEINHAIVVLIHGAKGAIYHGGDLIVRVGGRLFVVVARRN